ADGVLPGAGQAYALQGHPRLLPLDQLAAHRERGAQILRHGQVLARHVVRGQRTARPLGQPDAAPTFDDIVEGPYEFLLRSGLVVPNREPLAHAPDRRPGGRDAEDHAIVDLTVLELQDAVEHRVVVRGHGVERAAHHLEIQTLEGVVVTRDTEAIAGERRRDVEVQVRRRLHTDVGAHLIPQVFVVRQYPLAAVPRG